MRVLREYLKQAGPVTEANAWEHVYRCLLWFDDGAGLAHIYDSNHMQKGGNFHSRAVRFTKTLCSHWNVKTAELSGHLDVLFRGCVEELKRQEAEKPKGEPSTIDAEDMEAEIESELTVNIRKLLEEHGLGENSTPALADKIEALSRHYFTIGNKRQNALGEGFEDLLSILLQRVSNIPEKMVATRTPVSKLPGFLREEPTEEGGKKPHEPRPDIAIVDDNITHVITTAKWSIRQDRQTQFQAEYQSFQTKKRQPTELRYSLITNEFDIARLRNVFDAIPGGKGGYIFHDVYHISVDLLRQAHGAAFSELQPYVKIGKLKSLSDYLREMRVRYGEE
ncbi:hypothetical protein [Rhodoplanes sp. SY1]|uniref:hypothetical protein n=1 Tax=Rhodoplanes sp. SY1 TaxID=3166646 RepID=UPI0038B53372